MFSERNKMTTDRVTAWSFDMQVHAEKFIEYYCQPERRKISDLRKAETPFQR